MDMKSTFPELACQVEKSNNKEAENKREKCIIKYTHQNQQKHIEQANTVNVWRRE